MGDEDNRDAREKRQNFLARLSNGTYKLETSNEECEASVPPPQSSTVNEEVKPSPDPQPTIAVSNGELQTLQPLQPGMAGGVAPGMIQFVCLPIQGFDLQGFMPLLHGNKNVSSSTAKVSEVPLQENATQTQPSTAKIVQAPEKCTVLPQLGTEERNSQAADDDVFIGKVEEIRFSYGRAPSPVPPPSPPLPDFSVYDAPSPPAQQPHLFDFSRTATVGTDRGRRFDFDSPGCSSWNDSSAPPTSTSNNVEEMANLLSKSLMKYMAKGSAHQCKCDDSDPDEPPAKRGPGRPRTKSKKNCAKPAKKAKEDDKIVKCAICKEPNRDNFHTTSCGHIFHLDCLNNWLKSSKQDTNFMKTCPSCGSYYHEIWKVFIP